MSVVVVAPGPPSSTAVGQSSVRAAPTPSGASGRRQNASIRASSSRVSMATLLTCPYASRSDQRSWIGTVSRAMSVPLLRRCRIAVRGRGPSVPGQLAVRDTVRTRGLDAEPLDLVLLVGRVVALEPEPAARVVLGALVRQDVRRHPVEEPAVVRDDHGATGELEQCVLERTERLDIQVVGRLVEQQQVPADLEGQREVEPVALATGEHPGGLLLVRALEPERGDVRPGRHLDVADLDVVETVRDDLPQRLLRVDARAGLVDVGDPDRLADLQLAGVQRLEPDDGLEQRRLADAVRTDHADDAVARQDEREVLDQDPLVEPLLEVLRLDHDAAEARTRRDLDLVEVKLAGTVRLGSHLFVAREARLGLRLAALGALAHPLELVLEALRELEVLLALDLQPLLLLLQVGRVVALVRIGAAAVELEDPFGDVVQEVPVVGDGEDGTVVLREVLLEPEHALGIQVVGGLVQE